MTVIDVHSHVIPANVIEAITADPGEFAARIEGDNESRRVVHEQGFSYPLSDEFTSPEIKLHRLSSTIGPRPRKVRG